MERFPLLRKSKNGETKTENDKGWRERAAVSEHRFLAVGIDFRWREIAFLAAALGPLACLAEALGPLAWLT